jgi:hypothetical protein
MKKSGHAHDAAESSFKKKERRLLEGQKAMAEHNAALRSEDAKTARLKALRLARDATEALAPAKVSSTKKKKKKIAPASPSIAADMKSEGDKEQLQSDRLKMAQDDGARAPSEQNRHQDPE